MSALQDRIEELEEEVRQLREHLSPPSLYDAVRRKYRMSPQCSTLLAMLIRHEMVSYPMIDTALFSDRDDIPGQKIVAVLIHRVRSTIPSWAGITCDWGRGYSMSADARKRLRQELAPVEGLRPAGEAASRVLADLEARRNA